MAVEQPKSPFKARVMLASGWTLGGHVTNQVIRLASNLIMTRLLVPEMFGLMTLGHVILMGLQLFTDMGLGACIVQSRRGNSPEYLNTTWTMQILRGGVIWLLALAIALGLFILGTHHRLPAGSTYADPALPPVLAALSFNALIWGFSSTRLVSANRNLLLGRITLVEVGSQLAAILIMICWALWHRSIWALVAGSLFGTIFRVLLSHTVLPGEKNRLAWNREAVDEILGFGKWIFVSSILGFLASNGDRLLLGGLVDPGTLGQYAIALSIVIALQEVFSKLSSSVAFPAFSEVVRERPASLRHTYYRFRLPLDVASLLSMGVLLSAGHLVVQLLYDDRFQAAGRMIEILGISLFEVRYSLAGQCLVAMGKPKLLAPMIVVRLVALFVLMPLVFRLWGLQSALWIVGGSALFALPVVFFFKIRHGLFDVKRELVVLPLLGVGYLLGIILVWIVRIWIQG